MVKIEAKCDDCQKIKRITIGQTGITGKLTWFESHYCPFCGYVMEVDNEGYLPDAIRQIVFSREGQYCLEVDSSVANSKIRAIKIVRQALNLSMLDTKKMLNEFPHLVRGTKAEIEWLQVLLSRKEIKSTVRQI